MLKLIALPQSIALLLMAGLVFGCLESSAQLKGDSFAEAKAKGTANIMFTYVETPGFAAKEGAQVGGFCIELMNEFGKWLKKEEGIELKPVYHDRDSRDFIRFMNGMKKSSGGVFGLGTFTITEERKNTYTFSPPYITNVAVLITNKNVPNLRSMEEIPTAFKEMTIVTVKGSLNEKRLLQIKENYFPQAQVKYVGSFGEVLDELATNEKAFTELDFTFYIDALKQRMPVKRHPVGDEATEGMGIIMPKNSDWGLVMDRFMNSGFMGSTEYRKMIADHLGQHALKLLDAVSAK